jgi:hypothetical protein
MKACSGYQLVDRALAKFAGFEARLRNPLERLIFLPAFFAFVLVNGHNHYLQITISLAKIADFVSIAEAFQNQIQIRISHRTEHIPGDSVNLLFLLLFLFPGCIKINAVPVKPDNMNQFMGGNIEHERGQSNEGTGSFHRIENPVILKTNPIKVHPLFFKFRLIVLCIMVLA